MSASVLARLLKRLIEEARQDIAKGTPVRWDAIDEALNAMIESLPGGKV
jgi:predicted DNA-binding protein (UPF0278 family)